MNIDSVQKLHKKKKKNIVAVNLQIIINMGIYKCMQMYDTGSSAGCRAGLEFHHVRGQGHLAFTSSYGKAI